MAISVEIIETQGIGREDDVAIPVLEFPYNSFTRVSAAGVTALHAGTSVVRVRNKSTGDAVWFQCQLATSSATADGTTGILLEGGQTFDFALPNRAKGELYEIDVRAAS